MKSPHSIKFWGMMLLMWMGVIFGFSSMAGSPYPFDPPLWYFVERKGAHVFEYALLFFLSYNVFSGMFPEEKRTRVTLLAIVFSLMYAMTDELHQFFVPFRGSKFTDVLIDGMGIGVMALFLHLLSLRQSKQMKK